MKKVEEKTGDYSQPIEGGPKVYKEADDKNQDQENETHQDVVKEVNQVVEDKTQEEPRTIKLSDREAIEAYTNDPQIKEDHLKIAQQLQTIFGSKWFTVEMIVNKTLMKDKKHIMEMMLGLQLFKMVTAADGGINYKHQTKFKLTISIEDKMKVLQQHRENHLKQIELIDKEMEALSNEARESDNNEK